LRTVSRRRRRQREALYEIQIEICIVEVDLMELLNDVQRQPASIGLNELVVERRSFSPPRFVHDPSR
jgi:phospholipase/lecithinase/hemolysin